MDKPIYFISGQPGSSVHYVACLIKLFLNPKKFAEIRKTNQFGKYDEIFGAHLFEEARKDLDIGKELSKSEDVDKIKTILDGHYTLVRDYHIETNIFPVHIHQADMLEILLDKFPTAKILFITTAESDRKQVITNCLVKRFFKGLLEPETYGDFASLYLIYTRKRNLSLLDREKLTSINRENHPYLLELYDFINLQQKFYFEFYSKLPIVNDRTHEIKYSILNTDSMISTLEEIIGHAAPQEVVEFSSYFKINQPNFSTVMNLIQQVKTSTWADVLYNYAVPKLKELKSLDQCESLYNDCLKIYADK